MCLEIKKNLLFSLLLMKFGWFKTFRYTPTIREERSVVYYISIWLVKKRVFIGQRYGEIVLPLAKEGKSSYLTMWNFSLVKGRKRVFNGQIKRQFLLVIVKNNLFCFESIFILLWSYITNRWLTIVCITLFGV